GRLETLHERRHGRDTGRLQTAAQRGHGVSQRETIGGAVLDPPLAGGLPLHARHHGVHHLSMLGKGAFETIPAVTRVEPTANEGAMHPSFFRQLLEPDSTATPRLRQVSLRLERTTHERMNESTRHI